MPCTIHDLSVWNKPLIDTCQYCSPSQAKQAFPSFPSPLPLFHFLVLFSFLVQSKPKIPFHGLFFARNQLEKLAMQANISSIKSIPSITIMPHHQVAMSTPVPVCVSSYQATPTVLAVVLVWSQSAYLSISSMCVPGYQASLSIPSSISNQASSPIPQPVIMTSNQSTQSAPATCMSNQPTTFATSLSSGNVTNQHVSVSVPPTAASVPTNIRLPKHSIHVTDLVILDLIVCCSG